MNWRISVAATALVFMTCSAHATGQGNGVIQRWKSEDRCTKEAQTAFPDFAPGANARREAKLRDCLNFNNLPPREPVSPPH